MVKYTDALGWIGEYTMSSRSFDEMERMFDQMDRMFGQMRDRFARTEFGANIMDMPWNRGMTVDIYEDEDALMVVADLPGFERDEIEINIRGTVLDIRADHEAETEHMHRTRSISERVTIPADILEEEAAATYHNGVLEICLPYAGEREASHRIDID